MSRTTLFAAAVVATAISAQPGTGQTWTGAVNTDWNTAGNWNPATVPNSATAAVSFGDVGVGTVNISSSVQAQSLAFSSTSGFYTLTSNPGVTLSGVTAITVSAVGAPNIDLAPISTGSLLYPNVPSLTLTNTGTGFLEIGPNTVIGTPGSGGVIVNGPGGTYIYGSFAANPNNVIGGLTHNGPGTLDFAGDGTNLTGVGGRGLMLNGGTLNLDYAGNVNTKLAGGTLTLGGGLLEVTANGSQVVTQTITGGTVVAAGHTDVQPNFFGAGMGVTLAAGAITRNLAGTLDFTPSAVFPSFGMTTSTGTTFSLLGGGPAYATVNGGSTWATVSAGNIAAYSGYLANTYTNGTNVDVTTSNPPPASFTANSLRFNTGTQTLTLSGTNTLQSGGILVTPNAGVSTITGGTLTAPGSGELLVHEYGGTLSINSNLVSTAGLTKTGPGVLILGGNNTGLTGPININRDRLAITTPAAVNSASQINFNDDRTGPVNDQFFIFQFGSGAFIITPPIRIAAFNPSSDGTAFFNGSAASTVTLSGVISSAPALTTPVAFESTISTGEVDVTNTMNSFTGNVSVKFGLVGINSDANLGNAANTLVLDAGGAANGGLVFLNGGVTVARPVTISSPTRIVCNGTDSNTISGVISGAGGIYKDGTGTLTLTNSNNSVTGNVTVAAGTLSLGTNGGPGTVNLVTVAVGATFRPPTASTFHMGALVLNGGTFQVPTGGSQSYTCLDLTTSAAGGTLDFTGAGNDLFSVAPGTAININGNSTWLATTNGMVAAHIVNGFSQVTILTIAPGVTLNNGLALTNANAASGYTVGGGGTLFQNTIDSTNVAAINASVTVAQGSAYRVTDASSNGGVGNLGTGTFILDGGTFSYGGSTVAATTKAMSLTANGGTIGIESAVVALTADGAITGLGGLTKIGPGTLVLGSSTNSFTNLNITNGTVQTANDNTLGSGTVTVGPLGALSYTGSSTTGRAFALFSSSITVAAGQTLMLSGATVGGGFLRGTGAYAVTGGASLTGVTTLASTTINQTGAGSYTNFTNGGTLSVAAGLASPVLMNGFSNEGSGSLAVGAGSTVSAADFQTYGVLSLSPGSTAVATQLTNTGASPLFFNGGSRTFISIPANAGNFDAGIDLHGNNAVVAGGLFVNNGYVVDSIGAGTKTVIADFGSLVKGAGFYQNSVQTVNGGKFQSGNSPGKASFGGFTFGLGGVSDYVFAIDDATGAAGPSPDANGHVSGWGLVMAVQRQIGSVTTPGDFAWTATPAHPLTVALDTLLNPTTVGNDVAGPMAEFDPTHSYVWPAVQWAGSYTGPADAASLNVATLFDTSGFLNPLAGTFGWSLDAADHALSLTYAPTGVPEPGTFALTAAVLALGYAIRRRRARPRPAHHVSRITNHQP
jgi:autotransporter-associated beta strand protein